MLKAIVFNALRVVKQSRNGLLFAIKCLKSLCVVEAERQKKFLSIGTNSETKDKTENKKHRKKISLLNLHTTMTL